MCTPRLVWGLHEAYAVLVLRKVVRHVVLSGERTDRSRIAPSFGTSLLPWHAQVSAQFLMVKEAATKELPAVHACDPLSAPQSHPKINTRNRATRSTQLHHLSLTRTISTQQGAPLCSRFLPAK